MANNIASRKDGARASDWPDRMERMDLLPVHVRLFLKRLPLNYSVKHVAADFHALRDRSAADQIDAVARHYILDMVGRTSRTYGPDHPDATPSAYGKGKRR